jgi:glc operon protein GlcG
MSGLRRPLTFVFFSLTCVLLLNPIGAQEAGRAPAPPSAIRDEAHLFGAEAIKKALGELERIEAERHVPVLIETLESLQGQEIDPAATRIARQWGKRGVIVLIAKQERKVEPLRHPQLDAVMTKEDLHTIREAFVEGLRRGNADAALESGVRVISEVLTKAAKEGRAVPSGGGGAAEVLVMRNQVRLNLAGARLVQAAAEAKAAEKGWNMNIAVVDDGGHLLSFTRMDGARPASVATAITKATTAATFRQPTGPLPPGATNPDVLLNLSLQNAAAVSGGKITTLYGGVPIVVDGQVIGAVGVGGGTGEQDSEVARAGVNGLLEMLKQSARAE